MPDSGACGFDLAAAAGAFGSMTLSTPLSKCAASGSGSRASIEKARELAALLSTYQLRARLVLVPFGELQQQVVGVVEEGHRPVREGGQRPGEVELAPAHAAPGVGGNQGERVAPDGKAGARQIALAGEL